jgi:hypothetical protein
VTTKVHLTLEELANSMDELFMEMAELKEQNEALAKMLRERDKMNLLMVKHVERLTQEKTFLLMHLGMKYLEGDKSE